MEKFENSCTRASGRAGDLIRETDLRFPGSALLRTLEAADQFADVGHHFRIVAEIVLLRLKDLVFQPIEEEFFLGGHAGSDGASHWRRGEAVSQLFQRFGSEL